MTIMTRRRAMSSMVALAGSLNVRVADACGWGGDAESIAAV